MALKRLIIIAFYVLFLACCSCKTNKTVNHYKEGKWVYKDTVNNVLYKSKGKYNKSREIKTWKYYENRRLVKTEKYRDTICYIETFDHNGKVTSKGQSMILEEKDGTHWYLTGDWLFFDENDQVIGIKKYLKGELISEEAK
ncbi:hypothetical protein EZL74_02835 [Flavobacterium silvisoli]|uniref:Uncharacterized protein n=1 Tax=Flavobacterium silvisoli TaxID=2529433 RepID=A0A4Q9Z8Y5_9FLAO|nr:hypothetical protein [Flavobacterium silvisoli]TBX70627.1 hypothetical protein EZL74_02835 [Flavobacterium silvisoli]